MADKDKLKTGKVTLDIELQDLLDVVSRKGGVGPINEPLSEHDVEGEALKKAWYKHMLLSMEKLNDVVESIRRIDMVNLRNELKDDLLRIDIKIEKANDEFKIYKEKVNDESKAYKKDIIDPLNNKVITMWVKLGMLSLIAGCVGGGIIGLIFFVLREYFIKPAVNGGP